MRRPRSLSFSLALLASSVLHSLPFLIMMIMLSDGTRSHRHGQEGDAGGTTNDHRKIVPKPSPTETPPPLPVDIDTYYYTKPKIKHPNHLKDPCLTFYGGIGITRDGHTDIVFNVVKGYPAYYAGMEAGDTILSPGEILGEVGTHVTVTYQKRRTKQVITKTFLRDKICTVF